MRRCPQLAPSSPLQLDSLVAPTETVALRITFQVPPGRVDVCLQLLPTAQDVALKMYCKHTHHPRLQAVLAGVSLSCKVITVSDNNCEIHSDLTHLESMGTCEMLLPMALCYLHRNITLK